jgi:hypothetical protein
MKNVDYSSEICREAVQAWKRAALALEHIRYQQIAASNTEQSLEALAELFELASKQSARKTSGLVDQQRWFKQIGNDIAP